MAVLGHDGRSQPFHLGKLVVSIARSFQHDQAMGEVACLSLAQTVQEKLIIEHRAISVDDITALTHHVLQRYDPVAATQYAAQHDLIHQTRRRGRPSTSYGPLYSGR